ncbi:uncharacterized protein LOC106882615 [Octopus bimaculoides]|uniref:uncharacterized protein LOC106882615 n=1 Tax=Octopus bimaculoides TaxID=37653 RepID=UPI00071CEFB5|nr:uncharacterized protein LOC106882615 [Octopus bimaculoides]|eukprot:XP_014788841.1 PREDICTED: uncharacterized protein LOC106882615 [Octopus bimaculoides]
MLVALRNEDKLRNSDDINRTVTAEIPDVNDDPVLHDLLKKCMIHGLSSPCMGNGSCQKKFPKYYRDEMLLNLNGYPEYRRCNTGVTVQVGHHSVDNRNVVSYNAYLLKKYRAHINVEICSSVKSIKYLFKYMYKGHDCASVEVRDNPAAYHEQNQAHNEITDYFACLYVSPAEAMWRLSEFKLHDTFHGVYRLAQHFEDQKRVYFHRGSAQQAAQVQRDHDTTLTA